MQRPPPLLLDETRINAPAPDHYDPFQESNQGYSYSGMFGPAGANHKTRELMYETQVALEQEFNAKSNLLPQSIENELAAARLTGGNEPSTASGSNSPRTGCPKYAYSTQIR
ncbi:hypothetical protein [Pseudomonas sp. TWP3-2]|uniref:hypothetical protein n=1 Tax=Pseudomonas sp. TWP3-2 TaxID=2804574 RepID=UPI003CF8165C